MPIDFPNSPTNGQTFNSGTRTWTYDGSKWNLTSYGPVGPQGPQGVGAPTGGTTGQILVKNSATNYDYGWSSSPSLLPKGRVASAQTATSTAFASISALSGLTCNSYTYSNTRWYAITVSLNLTQFGGGAAITVSPFIYNSGAPSPLYTLPKQYLQTTDTQGYHATVVTNTLNGTYSLQVACSSSGTGAVAGDGTVLMSILAVDLGPV